MKGITEDKNGDRSSKRVAGISILAAAGVMAVILFSFALVKSIADPDTAKSVINALLLTGGGLLGVGVIEGFTK